MKRIALVILGLALIVNRVAAQDLERLFKAAVNTETVDRNCKAAIEQYKKVAAGSSRPLAAQALVRMADCYRKLGDAEAQEGYQRIVQDYADEHEAAAIARARLGSASFSTEGAVTRRVWTGPKADGSAVSPDGRLVTFFDDTGNLGVHDVSNGEDRLLTSKKDSEEEFG